MKTVWVWLLTAIVFGASGGLAVAQQAWVQVEARPSLEQAQDRASFYADRIENVEGYALRSGWFAIAIGPFTPFQAESELLRLRARGVIPRDSFLADGGAFRDQFWPVAGAAQAAVSTEAAEPVAEPVPAEETVAESRRAERSLSRAEREELQEALAWEGVYSSAIDGDFGPGTRRAMGAWQVANNFEATGVLSSAQRRDLLAAFRGARDSLGLDLLSDGRAGIEIAIPKGLMAFKEVNAPFVRYDATDGSDAQLLLISQDGGRGALSSLYEVIQTLEIVPPEGPRRLRRESFVISGANARITTEIDVELTADGLKGFALVWPSDDLKRQRLVLQALRASFTPIPGIVLPDAPAGDGTEQRLDLLAGLAVRTPERAQSGVFVDAGGAVVTWAPGLAGCGRVEIGDGNPAAVVAEDAGLGLALLEPAQRLAPLGVARIRAGAPRLQSDVALSGYSYGGRLGAPSVTFGTMEDVRGLDGSTDIRRLNLQALPGDAGGPVLDAAGQMMGVLQGEAMGSRQLPDGVALAVGSDAVSRFLAGTGRTRPAGLDAGAALDPEDLAALGQAQTTLVTCWRE